MTDSFNVGDAFIELRLRQDKLQRDSDETVKVLQEQKAKLEGVAKSAEDAGDRSGVAFTGMAELALKAVAVMGSIELALGAVNVGADILSGNIEDAAQGLEQLPAGIGPVVRQLKDLLGTLTGIKEQTESIQRATENFEQAMAQRYETSIRGLQAEEDALLNRLKIEQQIALLGEADSDEAARLKAEFDGLNRIAEAEQKIIEIKREAQKFQLSTGAEKTERSQEIADLEAKIKERELAVQGITNPFGINQTRVENYKEATALLEVELSSLRDLNKGRDEVLQSYKDQVEAIKSVIPELEKLNEAEQAALDRSIEKAKTEEQEREAQERIRLAERESSEKERILKKEFDERKRLARDAHQEELRLMKERRDEEERLRQAEVNQLTQTINLRSSLIQKQLRLEGRGLEADIDAITQRARDQFENAGSDEERRLINRNRDLDIEGAIRGAEKSLEGGAGASIGSLESAISNLQNAALQREDPSVAQRREQIQIAKAQQVELAGVRKGIDKLDKPAVPAVGP